MDSMIIESFQFARKAKALGKLRASSNFPMRKSA